MGCVEGALELFVTVCANPYGGESVLIGCVHCAWAYLLELAYLVDFLDL